jgi:hypothetical protein
MRRAKEILLAVALTATMALGFAVPANAAFGLKDLDVTFIGEHGEPSMQAGSHPFALTTVLDANTRPNPPLPFEVPDGAVKDLLVAMAPGLIGKPTAVPRCSAADFFTSNSPSCPNASAIGVATSTVLEPGVEGEFEGAVYNLQPPPGVAFEIGFWTIIVPFTIDIRVNPDPPYNVIATPTNVPNSVGFYASRLELWGNPADHAHDGKRGKCLGNGISCPVNIPEEPLLTMPTACTGPLPTLFEATSWEGDHFAETVFSHDNSIPPAPLGVTGCGKLGFNPAITAKPTSTSAETGSGLDFDVDFKDEGLTNPNGISQSTTKKAVVTLPEGVTVNPSVGEGLDVCAPGELDNETLSAQPGEGCPNASKIGSVRVDTPLLEEPVEGLVFLAQQDDPATSQHGAENPFDSLLAMYIVLKNPKLGVLIKLPAKIEPDPKTGQLVTTLEDTPQLPFSRFSFHFREGARAPLVTPPRCGTYETKAVFTPWANPSTTRTVLSEFKITSGVGGGSCPPAGVPPFHPGFEAGSVNNDAKAYSPFYMRLIRNDGEQDMTKFSSILPPGVLGKLSGVGKCSDSAIASAKAKTGREEIASPSCPANAEIGHTLAGAGVGGALTYVPGKIYLAGPYKGDPLSVVSITPAVAGPFDAGDVVVRLALTLNPKTAEVEVDGQSSDPIPHILKGIPLKVRDLRVYVDRPDFTLNPTSCAESSAKATLFGSYLDLFSSADDVPVNLSSRYQAANCLNLGFKPKLDLKLKGGTKRGGHPGLTATYTPRPKDANVKGLVVRLPRSAFLDQAHIRTICTRVQFAAKACPKGAQYGFIKAWTPLLEEPLEGPVYLRSSSHKLPDLVFDLHGLVDVEVATRIDSQKGGIRATVESAPDAPISKVLLKMQGQKKGLIINSRDLCAAPSKANVGFEGQNGKEASANPVLRPDCGGSRKGKRR